MKQSAPLRQRLIHVWNRKLYLWWQWYNDSYLKGVLKPPLIRLSEGETTLGQWDGRRRILSISVHHIERDPWLGVMDTLRHEMAHQYVDEVFQASHAPPHGVLFREACLKLRCTPRSRIQTAAGQPAGAAGPQEDRLVRRLKKVLSLTDSPHPHEAQSAVKKARYLLAKYSIDLVKLDQERRFSTRCLGSVKGRHGTHELWLSSILSDFFFVEAIWAHSYDPWRNRSGTVLQIFGTETNLDLAEYVYHYLVQLLDRLWDPYRRTRGMTSNRERQRYFAGVLEGFHQKLEQQEKTLRQEHALIWTGDPRLRAFCRYLHPRLCTRGWGGASTDRTHSDGLRQGRRVTIRQPISKAHGFGGYLKA